MTADTSGRIAGLIALIVAFTLALAAPGAAARSPELREPIRLALINSSDFDTVIAFYGAVLREAGYRVDYVNVDYAATWTAIQLGDIHVSMCWDTTWDVCAEGLENGTVLNTGSSGVAIREGWWYPSDVADLCPGLPDWRALKDPACVESLASAETAPKGRFVAPPADWVSYTEEIIEALELPFEPVISGSPAALIATLQGAVQRSEPVIGWGYVPHWFIEQTDGEFVDFPPYDPACHEDPSWGVNPDKVHDCGHALGWIWKFMNKEMAERAPYALRILYLFETDADAVGQAMHRVDVEGVPLEQVAKEWLEANRDTWRVWLR